MFERIERTQSLLYELKWFILDFERSLYELSRRPQLGPLLWFSFNINAGVGLYSLCYQRWFFCCSHYVAGNSYVCISALNKSLAWTMSFRLAPVHRYNLVTQQFSVMYWDCKNTDFRGQNGWIIFIIGMFVMFVYIIMVSPFSYRQRSFIPVACSYAEMRYFRLPKVLVFI